MPIQKVRKTAVITAVMISNPEEEALVRSWLAETGQQDADLSQLISAHVWFMRDPGVNEALVYIVHPVDFLDNYEDVEEDAEEPSVEEIVAKLDAAPEGKDPFTFE